MTHVSDVTGQRRRAAAALLLLPLLPTTRRAGVGAAARAAAQEPRDGAAAPPRAVAKGAAERLAAVVRCVGCEDGALDRTASVPRREQLVPLPLELQWRRGREHIRTDALLAVALERRDFRLDGSVAEDLVAAGEVLAQPEAELDRLAEGVQMRDRPHRPVDDAAAEDDPIVLARLCPRVGLRRLEACLRGLDGVHGRGKEDEEVVRLHLEQRAAVAREDRQADRLHLLDEHEEVQDALLSRDPCEAAHVGDEQRAVDGELALDGGLRRAVRRLPPLAQLVERHLPVHFDGVDAHHLGERVDLLSRVPTEVARVRERTQTTVLLVNGIADGVDTGGGGTRDLPPVDDAAADLSWRGIPLNLSLMRQM